MTTADDNYGNSCKTNDSTTIGIDLGTSHCTAAVWDSTRGHPKWMRLGALAYRETTTNKDGRVMPSAILFATRKVAEELKLQPSIVELNTILPEYASSPLSLVACVGASAVQALERAETKSKHDNKNEDDNKNSGYPTYEAISAALVTSSKRLLGLEQVSPELQSCLSLNIATTNNDQGEIILRVRPLGYHDKDDQTTIDVTPSQATSILLLAIKLAAEAYLRQNTRQKKLQVPGNGWICTHAVIGVPAHYTQRQRQLVTRAATAAGLSGHVSILTESTAAAMAYGIFVSRATTQKTLLVLDSGGGTTDVTIAVMAGGPTNSDTRTTTSTNDQQRQEEESQRFRVIVTEGDARLGGDDMDAALLAVGLEKVGIEQVSNQQRRQLLHTCRWAKEQLCGDLDHGYQKQKESVSISILNEPCELSQHDLEQAVRPWIDRGTKLVCRALERYAAENKMAVANVTMHEVILVGGATRVPAVRRMLRDIFPPPPELCLSVNAMSAVAQGAAIQAAIQSGKVPLHEVRSAMMLDTVPYAIGVLLPDGETFVEIIARDAPLPAFGSAVFQLASLNQSGVTVVVVEQVQEDGQLYPKLGEFTFMLARLPKTKLDIPRETRSIEIRMNLLESGEFRVSYYDENDPDHAGLKMSSKEHQNVTLAPDLLFQQDEYSFPFEQIMLVVSCIILLCSYVAARIYFQDELSAKSE